MKNSYLNRTMLGGLPIAALATLIGTCDTTRAWTVIAGDNLQLYTSYASTPGTIVSYGNGAAMMRNITFNNPSNQVEPPGGGTITVNSFFDVFIEVSSDGGGYNSYHDPVAAVGATVTYDYQTGATRYYNTEIQTLSIHDSIHNFQLRIDATPIMPSAGLTTIVTDTGYYHIDSFFDVFTELSTDGGLTWLPATAVSLNGGASWISTPLGGSFRIESVPEPSAAAVALLGGTLVLKRRRANVKR